MSVIQEELVLAERDWLATNPIEITMKDIINGKPGYDPENGLYRIDGGVVMHTVHYRKNTKANVVQTIGLKVTRYKDIDGVLVRDAEGVPIILETLCVTKDEAVDLARKFGVTNGYIKTQISKKTGEKSHFIQPAPARTESFTRDDRLTFLYELNQEDGKFKKPYVLKVQQETCSSKFWLFVESDYSLKKARDKRKHQAVSDSKRKVEQLKVDLQRGRLGVINPFRK